MVSNTQKGTAMTFEIRQATPDDYPAIAALQTETWTTAYAPFLPPDYVAGAMRDDLAQHWEKQALKTGEFILLAEDDTGILGFVTLQLRPEPFIDNLHVSPRAQGKGVGRRLMSALAKRLIEAGHGTVALTVITGNTQARAFYEAVGGRYGALREGSLFGNKVDSIWVEWPDLTVLRTE